MKRPANLLLLLFLLPACSVTDNKATENIALVEEYVLAVESKEYSKMEMLLAENYKGFGPSHSDSTNRETALITWKENIENLYESISYKRSRYAAVTIKEGPNMGEWVSNWAELVIEYKDGSGPVTIWTNTNYQIENGKIVKSYTFYNEADVLRQLGYVFIQSNDL